MLVSHGRGLCQTFAGLLVDQMSVHRHALDTKSVCIVTLAAWFLHLVFDEQMSTALYL